MLRKVTLLVLLCTGALGSQMANAQVGCGMYYGLDLGNGKLQSKDSDLLELKDFQGTFGCQLMDNVGVETRLGFSAKEFGNIFGDADVTHASVLARLNYKGDRVLVYGLAGAGYIDVKQIKDNKISPVLGVGLELFGSPRTAIHFGYTVQPTEKNNNVDLNYGLFNLGYRHYFSELF